MTKEHSSFGTLPKILGPHGRTEEQSGQHPGRLPGRGDPSIFSTFFYVNHFFIFPKENKGNSGLLYISIILHVSKVCQHFNKSATSWGRSHLQNVTAESPPFKMVTGFPSSWYLLTSSELLASLNLESKFMLVFLTVETERWLRRQFGKQQSQALAASRHHAAPFPGVSAAHTDGLRWP